MSGGDVVMTKINQDGYSSEYLFRDATSQFRARIRHTKTAAKNGRPSYDRHNCEVVETIFEASEVAEYERKFYFVLEHLPSDTSVEMADGVADLAILTSNAFLTALLGWES
jgi:hypothetical protein